MKDAECAETKEKSYIMIFIFRVMVIFVLKIVNFRVNHNSKNKNRKNLKYDSSFDSALCAFFMGPVPSKDMQTPPGTSFQKFLGGEQAQQYAAKKFYNF